MTDVLTENASLKPAESTTGPSLSDFVTRAANGQAADGRRDLVGHRHRGHDQHFQETA